MAGEVEVRRFERGDEARAINLLLTKVPPAEREAARAGRVARWQWQYYANPNNPDGNPLIWVAQVGGDFGGMVATVPVKVRTPKGPMLGMWGVDFIVDGRMRGKGLGRKLLEAWLKTSGIAFVRGWSPVSFRVATGVGFEVVWGFTASTIPVSRFGLARQWLRQGKKKDLLDLAKVFALPNARRRKGVPGSITDEMPPGTGRLCQEVLADYTFAVERDEAYLKWRYMKHPTQKYDFICAGSPAEPTGLVFAHLTDDDPPLGVISDLMVHPGDHDSVLALVGEAMAVLASKGAYAVLADLPPALASTVGAKYRCSIKRNLGMIVCSRDKDLSKAGIFTPGAWYLSRSDADEDY
jgi:GNAT superfamily N-acetyltransferase